MLIADNGSTDGSQEIARGLGARVVDVAQKGYGAALLGGIAAARGKYTIMGDADDSYDFSSLQVFVDKLRQGVDLVMGNRFKGGIAPGAMPPLHRYLGNPVLSWIGRLFFRISIGDFHCGLRGFNTEAIRHCDLKTTGMEFASEMVVKASLYGLSMAEVPTTLAQDGRSRPPHLRTWRDGWRHLCFLLTYAPHWLYMYPALALMGVGLLGVLLLLSGPLSVGSVTFANKSFVTFAMLLMLGMQVMGLGVVAAGLAGTHLPGRGVSLLARLASRDRLAFVALAFLVLFVSSYGYCFSAWSSAGYGDMASPFVDNLSILAIVFGAMAVFSFMLAFIIAVCKEFGMRH
ncbi:glycosyltransferase family 2 protein [Desulfovibrio sp.]|uniref:glycosyltransferase family 2 protein n=1 Tax=Desulfovibrio sp. TaxID=885 RepID=UPI003AB5B44C